MGIGAHLAQEPVGDRRGGLRHDPVRFVIHRQHPVGFDDEPIDRAEQTLLPPWRGHIDLGERVGAEEKRQIGRGEHAPRLGQQVLGRRRIGRVRRGGHEIARALGPGRFGPAGQVLQQQVDLPSPAQRGRLVAARLACQRLRPAKIRGRARRGRGLGGWGGGIRPAGQIGVVAGGGVGPRGRWPGPLGVAPARRRVAKAEIMLLRPGMIEPVADAIVPAGLVPGPAGRRHDEPALRARHRDIEKPRILGGGAFGGDLAARAHELGAVRGGRLPDRGTVRRVDGAAIARRPVARIGQDHHRRLQPLGAMHRHHPDARPGGVELALDDHVLGLEPGQEARQARHLHALMRERLREQRVHPVLGLVAEPRQKPPAPVMARQHPFDELEGAQEIRLPTQIVEHRARRGAIRALAQRLPEIPRAPLRKRVKLTLRPAAKR